MPSINLLPENFTIEAYKKKERIAMYVLAVSFLAISAAAYAKTEIDARQESNKSTTLDASIDKVKSDIQESIENSNVLSSKYDKDDVEKLLNEHAYFSKAFSFLKETVINGAYASNMKISAEASGDFLLETELYAVDFNTLLNQSSVLQNSFWVKSADIGELKYNKEKGVSCMAKLVLRGSYFKFHDQYWDFGTDILVKNANKYVKIDNYSVVLEKGKNAAQQVSVSFSGKSYDSDKLDEFKKKLKAYDNVSSVEISELESKNDNFGVKSFRGSAVLKY